MILVVLRQPRWNFSEAVQRLASELDQVLSRPARYTRRRTNRAPERLTAQQQAQLVSEYATGLSTRDLAARWRINRHTVTKHLERAGVSPRYQPLDEILVAEATRLYLAGWSLARLEEQFGRSAEALRQALRAAGVPMRKPWERG
jgi:DNA-binding CsgD family transcriptional regulator